MTKEAVLERALDREETQEFLDRFARALTSGDIRTIRTLWEAPALVLGDEMSQDIRSLDDVERFFAGAKDEYNRRGITDTRAEILSFEPATERIASVRVRWPYLDADGVQRGAESSTYIVRRDDDGELKIRAVVMHGVEAA